MQTGGKKATGIYEIFKKVMNSPRLLSCFSLALRGSLVLQSCPRLQLNLFLVPQQMTSYGQANTQLYRYTSDWQISITLHAESSKTRRAKALLRLQKWV